jgi:hypothetical protein
MSISQDLTGVASSVVTAVEEVEKPPPRFDSSKC